MNFNDFDSCIGEELYKARVVKHLTQDDVVNAVSKAMIDNGYKKGITRQGYSLYEKGSRSMPHDVFKFACQFLNIDDVDVYNKACDALKIKRMEEKNEV